jgi:hypothetical protein
VGAFIVLGVKKYGLLGCDTLHSGRDLPTFQMIELWSFVYITIVYKVNKTTLLTPLFLNQCSAAGFRAQAD